MASFISATKMVYKSINEESILKSYKVFKNIFKLFIPHTSWHKPNFRGMEFIDILYDEALSKIQCIFIKWVSGS
jgi:hypothetical protein